MTNSTNDRFMRFAGTESVRTNLKERSVRSALLMAIGTSLDLLLRLLSIAILARLLVPEYFGLIAMVTALTGILDGVKDLGLTTATVQRRDLTSSQVTNLFWVNATAGFLLMLLFCAMSPIIAAFYRDQRLSLVTVVLSTTFLWNGLSVQHRALMTRQLRHGELAAISIVANMTSVACAITLALAGWGYWSLVWREAIRSLTLTIVTWLRCPWLPGIPRKAPGTADLLRLGKDMSYVMLLYGVITNVDRLLVGRVFGAGPLGQYRLAHQTIAQTVDQFNVPIGSVANPGLSILQNDPLRYQRYYYKMVFLVALGTMPAAAFGTIYASELATVLLGEAWAGAAPYFAIFAASAFIRPVLGTASSILISSGKSRRFLKMMIISNVTFIGLVVAGLPFGPTGVAAAHLLMPMILLLPNLCYAFNDSPIGVGGFFRAIRTPALASIMMAAGLLVCRAALPIENRLASLGSGMAVGVVSYLVACISLPGGRAEIDGVVRDVATSVLRGWSWSRRKQSDDRAGT